MTLDLDVLLSILGVLCIAGAWLMFSIWRRVNRGELFDEKREQMIDTLKLLKEEITQPPPAIQCRIADEWHRNNRGDAA